MSSIFTWKRIRKFVNDIHLWLGIGSGLILFIVCLTGTIYTFHSEIDEWLNSDKYRVNVAMSGPLKVEELASRLSNEVEGQVTSVRIYPSENRPYRFTVKKEGERRGTTYLMNQYNGEILGDTKTSASEFFMTVFRLHRWLLMDTKVGRPIVGWSTLIFVFIILSGLVIWVPQKVKSWKRGLKIKWDGNWKRINHDLHNTLGFYSAIFLLVMALTGLQWSFEWYRTGLRRALGVEQSQQSGSKSQDENVLEPIQKQARFLTVAELVESTDRELPYVGSYRIEIPSEGKPTLRIDKYSTGFFASPAPDVLRVDPYSGDIISRDIFAEKPFNEKIARSIKALHVGDVFGTFSKIIYFITCLFATSMPITGTIIWLNKLQKKSKRRKKKEAQLVVEV